VWYRSTKYICKALLISFIEKEIISNNNEDEDDDDINSSE